MPVIGPTEVVPNPTDTIFIYSSSIFKILFGTIDVIPVTPNTVEEFVICPPLSFNVVFIGVNDRGDWMMPSISIRDFSSFLYISNLWLLPDPDDVNVTYIPLEA